MSSHARKHKRELKARVEAAYTQAELIGVVMGSVLNGSKASPVPPLWELFPELYPSEAERQAELQAKLQLEQHKAYMRARAAQQSRKGAGDNGKRNNT